MILEFNRKDLSINYYKKIAPYALKIIPIQEFQLNV